MIRYVFVYCGLQEGSFLQQGIGLRHLSDLRIGKETYLKLLQAIPAFCDAAFVLWERPMPFSQEEIQVALREWQCQHVFIPGVNDKICVLDMCFYPFDMKTLEHLLLKAVHTDLSLHILHPDAKNPVLSIGAWDDIAKKTIDEGAARVEFSDAQLLNLRIPLNALLLFSTNITLRHFNAISVSRAGYFLKQSANKGKMLAEYCFLKDLPSALRPYYPHCGDHVEKENCAAYEIEIIPCLDVAKSLLNGFFREKEACNSLLKQIQEYLLISPRKAVSTAEYRARMHDVFVVKTQQRMTHLYELAECKQLDCMAQVQGWDSLKSFADAYIQLLNNDIASHAERELILGHGDLFFGNMLYDPIKQKLKLIDPRGGCSLDACWLPPWYDLAKLSHSFLGHYDFMVHGLLEITLKEDLRLHVGLPDNAFGVVHLEYAFREMLANLNICEKRLRLYEGSLFLSMMPLHKECPLRMGMQLLRAMEIYALST